MDKIAFIEAQIAELREQLKNHKLYTLLNSPEDVKTFAQYHVFAVWDFMSLLKALQRELTCVEIPWVPKKNAVTARFINEIVHGEETDLNEHGVAKSHFDMYVEAMEQMEASTIHIDDFIHRIKDGYGVIESLQSVDLPKGVIDFVQYSFQIIETQKAHQIASAFTFGREDVIPDIFLEILKGSTSVKDRFSSFIYYLERHIELDGDEHGPLSLKMIEELCGDDAEKWEETLVVAKKSLQMRIRLWDTVSTAIEQNQLALQAVLN